MRYHIITYGCQMNISDSEKITAALKKAGRQPALNTKLADLIVLNACSVRQSAIDRIYGQIQKFPDKKIIIAGCLLDYDKKRLAAYKNVSFWQPDKYFSEESLRGVPRSGATKQSRTDTALHGIAELPSVARNDKVIAYVPVMTGCNNFCSYCVVPFTRGKEKSRPTQKIIKEIKLLIKSDYKEIILIGQNINSYHSSLRGVPRSGATKQSRIHHNGINFAALLKTINDIPGNFRLSFLTSHPKDMSDELIETMTRCQKLIKEIHLPVQSGDNQILKKMNRHYTIAHYKNLTKKIRRAIPDVKISTDIIVGFPNETKKQFQNTVKLAKAIKFDKAYIAKYSPRPGTAAAKLKDTVPAAEKTRRWRILDTLINKFEHH